MANKFQGILEKLLTDEETIRILKELNDDGGKRMSRNCQNCKYYKDGYCENLDLEPYNPQEGCEDYEMVKHATRKSFDDPDDIVDFINEHHIKKDDIVGIVRRDSICLGSNMFRYYLIYFDENKEEGDADEISISSGTSTVSL